MFGGVSIAWPGKRAPSDGRLDHTLIAFPLSMSEFKKEDYSTQSRAFLLSLQPNLFSHGFSQDTGHGHGKYKSGEGGGLGDGGKLLLQ